MFNTIRQAIDDTLNETAPAVALKEAAAASLRAEPIKATASSAIAAPAIAVTPVATAAAATAVVVASSDSNPSASPAAPAATPRSTGIADITRMGDTIVATLTELELCGDAGAARLDDLLDTLHQSGCTNFILDLLNVRLIDSCCLGTMVATANRLAAAGGRIALVNPAHSVEQLFRLTRLDRVFTIHKDVMSALQALERKAEQRTAS
jgi:anti-sigma B factor antagonist